MKRKSVSLVKKIHSLFSKKDRAIMNVNKAVDKLWDLINAAGDQHSSEDYLKGKVTKSFAKLRLRYPKDLLDNAHFWPRMVNIAIRASADPIQGLVDYVDDGNFKVLTSRLGTLYRSDLNTSDKAVMKKLDVFSEAVYHHIIEHIHNDDVPSLLALGKIAQRRGEYPVARSWFRKISDPDAMLNAVTSIIASYEEEIRKLLPKMKRGKKLDMSIMDQVKSLSEAECALYDKWLAITKERLEQADEPSEKDKADYATIIAGYAKFERNRGDFDKSMSLIEMVPADYPEYYRVLKEEALLYQCKRCHNPYCNLERAAETFSKAYDALLETNAASVLTQKCILMPLANTYFQMGAYEEAMQVANKILKLDKNEKNAHDIKKKILSVSSGFQDHSQGIPLSA